MVDNLFLTFLSMTFTSKVCGRCFSPCLLQFLSLQMEWAAAWKVYLNRYNFTRSWLSSSRSVPISSHFSVYLPSSNPFVSFCQTSLEYEQEKQMVPCLHFLFAKHTGRINSRVLFQYSITCWQSVLHRCPNMKRVFWRIIFEPYTFAPPLLNILLSDQLPCVIWWERGFVALCITLP